MLKNLEYFVGKICTIFTVQINFRYKEEAMMAYFMGYVDSVDTSGIIITHPQTKCRSFIPLQHLVAISEEQTLYDDNPEDAKLIEEYRQKNPITAEKLAIPPNAAVFPDKI